MLNGIKAKAAAGLAALGLVLSGGAAYAATTGGDVHPQAKQIVCVKYGPHGLKDATGNVMLWDWNRSACPAGTYRVVLDPDDQLAPVVLPTGGASTGTTQATQVAGGQS